MTPLPASPPRTWFGAFDLAEGDAGLWRVGPYELWAARLRQEWRVSSYQGSDPLDSSLHVEVPCAQSEPPEHTAVRRYGFETAPAQIELNPALADRPVVVSPDRPLHVPAGERIVLFLSLPAWVELKLGRAGSVLIDEPTYRPTDSWFGPSTMKGELCYATRTAARMNIDNLPFRPHRVISVVGIKNRARSTLFVEKLKIPVIHQSIYGSAGGGLWTETVELDHRDDGALAGVSLGKGPPAQARGATLLRGPREAMEAGLLTRAFSGLLE